MIATSPDGQWAAVRRGREVSLLAGGAGPPTSSIEIESDDADMVIVGPPSVLAVVTRGTADGGHRMVLYLPPYLEAVAQLELDGPMRIATVTGPRVVLLSPDGKAVMVVRIAGRGLSAQSIDTGSPVEFAVGLERNQVLFALLRKLEAWDAVSGRPLLRMQLALPPPPRLVGPAHGHVWAVRPGGDEVRVCRLSDGRPFQHQLGASVLDVVYHPASPLLILVTARGLVRLHCFAHALTLIEAPWQPGAALAQLVVGDEIALLGIAEHDEEPWRVQIGGAGAPAVILESPDTHGEPLLGSLDRPRAVRHRMFELQDPGPPRANDRDDFESRFPPPAPEPLGSGSANGGGPDAGRADMGRADMGRADMGRADMGRADMGRADMGRADMGRAMGRAEMGRAEIARLDIGGSEASRSDVARLDIGRTDIGRPEAVRSDVARLDIGRTDIGRPEAARSDVARLDIGRTDIGRPEAARFDIGRTDIGRPDVARHDSGRLDAVRADWRDGLAALGAELVRGAEVEVLGVGGETEIGRLAERLALGGAARRALVVLYGAYLVGEPAVAIARAAQVLGEWSEALGQGDLGALAMLRRRGGKVALRGAVTDVLDGAAPRAIRIVGTEGMGPRAGVARLARDGKADSAIERELAGQLGRIGVIEGSGAVGVLEARLHGATAVALVAPAMRPVPWPRDAGLIVVADGDTPAWVAGLPSFTGA